MSDVISVLAFWKGTSFPDIVCIKQQNWDELEKATYGMIVEGLKEGITIDQQAQEAKKWLDDFEQWLHDWYTKLNHCVGGSRTAKRTGKVGKRLKKDIQKKFNMSMDDCQAIWYMHISHLLKLKKIENDDKYGFLFMKSSETLHHFWGGRHAINRITT